MLRRSKAEVELSLPEKREIHLFIGLTDCQTNIYRNLLLKRNLTDSADDKKFYLNVLM